MLKDIKNAMKRPISSSLSAELYDLQNHVTYDISTSTKFVIGRAITSSLIIHEVFVSRNHCDITYKNGSFMICNHNISRCTFLNRIDLLPGENNAKQLRDGDLISIGDQNTSYYVYKFSLCNSTPNSKVYKIDEDVNSTNNMENMPKRELNVSILKVNSQLNNMKVEKKQLHNFVGTVLNDINKQICNVNDDFQKLKHEYETNIEIVKNNAVAEHSEQFRTKLHGILENDIQCPVCNEIIVKATTVNCSHTFCELCINKWLEKSNVCPICRSTITNTFSTICIDSLITNICDLIGGDVKEQRDILLNERNAPVVLQPAARRGRRVNVNLPRRQQQRRRNIVRDLDNIDVVDLTNQSPL